MDISLPPTQLAQGDGELSLRGLAHSDLPNAVNLSDQTVRPEMCLNVDR